MRVLIACGGTGGHIYPGLAVAEVLKKDGAQILFVGTAERMEADLVPRAGYDLATIKIVGFNRSLSFRNIFRNLINLIRLATLLPLFSSMRIIRRFRPDVIMGTGGYVCGPVLLAGKLLGYPTLVCETNSYPGLTNRILARLVDRVTLGYEVSRKFFPTKTNMTVTGSPVRPSFFSQSNKSDPVIDELNPQRKTILVVGGSLGAAAINKAVQEACGILDTNELLANSLQVIHVLGKRFFSAAKSAELKAKFIHLRYLPVDYIHEMAGVMQHTDLIICRAGASVISEVTTVGLPAICIPWSGAAEDHQTLNATMLRKAGAGMIISDQELCGEALAQAVQEILCNDSRLEEMKHASRSLAQIDASEQIVKIVKEMGRGDS